MTPYLIVSTIFFFLFGLAWTRKDLLNLFVKVAFISLSVWGFVLSLMQLGFIIKN